MHYLKAHQVPHRRTLLPLPLPLPLPISANIVAVNTVIARYCRSHRYSNTHYLHIYRTSLLPTAVAISVTLTVDRCGTFNHEISINSTQLSQSWKADSCSEIY